jgi:hypothetical protein
MRTERRRHPRYDIMAHVRVKHGTVNYVLDVINISLSGVFVSTVGLPRRTKFITGQSIEMNIFLPDEVENVHVLGRIVRTVEQEDPPICGFGVEFVDIDEKARVGIALLVEIACSSVLPPPFPNSDLDN